MRRMITETLMQKIKRLFKSVWSDDEGNVEVGKNLEVDGYLVLNSVQDIKDRNGKNLLPIFQHTVTITGTETSADDFASHITFTAYSAKNTPIDSYQDLHDLFGGRKVSATGAVMQGGDATTVSYIDLIDLQGGTIATDKLTSSNILEGNPTINLSQIGEITFADDVCCTIRGN